MKSVYANRNSERDFVINELERWSGIGGDIYIASAFFTNSDVVEQMLCRDCTVYMVVRLGFPTSPDAINRVLKYPNMHLRIYTGHSFHPKLYILGDEVALVGSANLTRSALMTNQEVVVAIDSSDERLSELSGIFQGYWDGAEVPTADQLTFYKDIYREFAKLDAAVDVLGQRVLDKLGSNSPENIDRSGPKPSKRSLFTSNFRRTYQEGVAAFNVVRRVYEASRYRKVSEDKIPLRIEIDSFF